MSTYCYMTLSDGETRDGEVVDLPDVATARRMATDYASELLRDVDGAVFDHPLEIRVTNQAGLLMWVIDIVATEAPAAKRATSLT